MASFGISIRPATLADSDAVSALLRDSYPTLMRRAYDRSVLAKTLPFMTVAQPKLLESGSYYVAESSTGAIIGCGGWTRERPDTGEVMAGLGHIRHFGVHTDWTRRGAGRAIYTRCLNDARNAGIQRFECYSSLNGEAFYSALGFVRLGLIEVEMPGGGHLPSVHMAAKI